jgi:hypothetical protein
MQDVITNSNRCLSQTQDLSRDKIHCAYDLFRKLYSWREVAARDRHPIGIQSWRGLLHSCLRDLRTHLFRIRMRVERLPWQYTSRIGPVAQFDTSGNLKPCTRTLMCMRDIQSFEVSHPEATEFDIEYFHLGWQMGAEWIQDNAYNSRPEGKP